MKEKIVAFFYGKEGEYGSVHLFSVFLLRRWLQSEAGLGSGKARRNCN